MMKPLALNGAHQSFIVAVGIYSVDQLNFMDDHRTITGGWLVQHQQAWGPQMEVTPVYGYLHWDNYGILPLHTKHEEKLPCGASTVSVFS